MCIASNRLNPLRRSAALRREDHGCLANPMFEQFETSGIGRHMAAASPVPVGSSARASIRPAPLLGADTDDVLHQVPGLDSRIIGRLHDAGVVADPWL